MLRSFYHFSKPIWFLRRTSHLWLKRSSYLSLYRNECVDAEGCYVPWYCYALTHFLKQKDMSQLCLFVLRIG